MFFNAREGRLAQLVQSICLTSRGSAVRIRQLNRASDYGSEGYRFESCRSHKKSLNPMDFEDFFRIFRR